MEVSSLSKKLQIKSGQTIIILNAPDDYRNLLEPLPGDVSISSKTGANADQIQIFVLNAEELEKTLQIIQPGLGPNTIFWIAYPKKSSGIQSDLDMMTSWKEPEKYGFRPVASIAINDTWTALRFKQPDQVKKSGISNSDIQKNELSQYIDVVNRIITIPPHLKTELDTASLEFFESLAWSHKKEYITWIMSAKQEQTQLNRIRKTADMLANKKKNPTEK
jgi:hypothetical protein